MREWLKRTLQRLESSKLAPLVQFVKFGLVGISNTVISYVVDMLFFYWLLGPLWQEGSLRVFGNELPAQDARTVLCKTLGFIAGVLNSYLLNSRYVFQSKAEKRPHPFRSFLKLAASSLLTSLVLSSFLTLRLQALGLPNYLATLCALAVTIPLNFLFSKFWAFRER